DSIAPSMAMVIAGPNSSRTVASVTCGTAGCGSEAARLPNFVPIVVTGQPATCAITVVRMSATNGAGIRALTFGQTNRMAMVMAQRATAYIDVVPRNGTSATMCSMGCAGIGPARTPNAASSWVTAIVTAIALVKPMITGCGTNLMRLPSLATPMTTSSAPA